MADSTSEYHHSLLAYFITDWNIYSVSSFVCGLVILAFLVKMSRRSTTEASINTSRCSSSSCARCHGETEIQEKLLQRLRDHVRCHYEVQPKDIPTYLSQNYARIQGTIESYNRKAEILSSIYHESGHSDVPTKSLAHVWMMPGLRRTPLWSGVHVDADHTVMEKLFSIFQDPGNFENILQEYKAVSGMEGVWKENNIPTGSWRTYFLMNQGAWVQENAVRCPQTVHLLDSASCLMEGIVFGNVLFSVLKPGSSIEPHTSPCNFRLRCHLALNASSGFSIRVGKCTATWRDGQLLVFDDSFVHSVSHENCREDTNPAEDSSSNAAADSRVVLIFDIWHPDINHREQQALKCMFE